MTDEEHDEAAAAERELAIAAIAAAPGDTEALAIALGAVAPDAQDRPEEVVATVASILELLDEAGWYFRPPSEATEGEHHPASPEQRLEALRLADADLARADVLARWLATGTVPGPAAPLGVTFAAELSAAAEALAEWDGHGDGFGPDEEEAMRDAGLDAATGLAHAVRQLLNAAGS